MSLFARQVGAMIIGFVLFVAFIMAMSRLLEMKELPDYITNLTRGLSNLFAGAFDADNVQVGRVGVRGER